MSDASFQRAKQQYARLRRSAYALAREDALASGFADARLRLTGCDQAALSVWRATWAAPHPSGWGNWNWEPLLRSAWKQPSAFHLAIWSGETLCGLAVGRVSDRDQTGTRNALSLHFIESAPDRNHPLRGSIASLATRAAQHYGHALQVRWLRLVDPLPGLIERYERLGFTVVRGKSRVLYCERRIEP
jgi:hypothetical protein